MWTKQFWQAVAERAISTAAEAAAAAIGVSAVAIQTIDWPTVLGIAATAALLSALKNLIIKPAEVTAQEQVAAYEAQHERKEG